MAQRLQPLGSGGLGVAGSHGADVSDLANECRSERGGVHVGIVTQHQQRIGGVGVRAEVDSRLGGVGLRNLPAHQLTLGRKRVGHRPSTDDHRSGGGDSGVEEHIDAIDLMDLGHRGASPNDPMGDRCGGVVVYSRIQRAGNAVWTHDEVRPTPVGRGGDHDRFRRSEPRERFCWKVSERRQQERGSTTTHQPRVTGLGVGDSNLQRMAGRVGLDQLSVGDASENRTVNGSGAVGVSDHHGRIVTLPQAHTRDADHANQRSDPGFQRPKRFSYQFHHHSMPRGDTLCAVGLICSRIGCREKAAASLQFDAERSTAILIDLTHARNGMPLCERHASSRTAPVGWQMVDRRTGARKMEIWSAEQEGRPAPAFAAPTDRPAPKRPSEPMTRRVEDRDGEDTPAAAPTRSVPEERPAAKRPQPEPVAEPEPAPVTAADDAPQSEFRWPKQSDQQDDEDKQDIAADSPLLSRAFRAAK